MIIPRWLEGRNHAIVDQIDVGRAKSGLVYHIIVEIPGNFRVGSCGKARDEA